MNRSEFRQQVINNTNRPDKTDVINNAIDEAVRKVSAAHLWTDLLVEGSGVLTPNINTFTLTPTDLKRLVELRGLDGLSSWSILGRSKSWVVSKWPDPTAQAPGKPVFAYLEGRVLHMVPPPDIAYSIAYSYYRVHPRLTSDTDTNLITHADEAVTSYATYRTLKSLMLHEDAQQWFADYLLLIRDAKQLDRSPAVSFVATPRGIGNPIPADYWLNPFIKEVPWGNQW